MSEMDRAYARCLYLERERERKHRKYTACAASDARAFHYEAPQTHGEDDEELDYGWDVTDEGDGAEAARSFEERRNGSYYTRRIKIARERWIGPENDWNAIARTCSRCSTSSSVTESAAAKA